MANTRETMGEAACLDALVAKTLTSFEDDAVKKVTSRALSRNTALTNIKLPNCKTITAGGLENCRSLVTLEMTGSNSYSEKLLDSNSCSGCSALSSIILHCQYPPTIEAYGMNSLNDTPIDREEGAVYVESEYVDNYFSDQRWRQLVILPISSYPASNFETITDSWSQIATKCANGEYATAYRVGDRKAITIDGTTYLMVLAAKDYDVLASDGTTTVPTTWLMSRKLYNTMHQMNATTSSTRSWAASDLRAWLTSDVFPLLPQDVQTAIKEVRKYTGKYENNAVVKDDQTSDKLWIPSEREVLGTTTYETQGGSYYPIFNKGSGSGSTTQHSNCKYLGTTKKNWWLRSCASATQFRYISDGGSTSASSTGDYVYYGVCFGFCI